MIHPGHQSVDGYVAPPFRNEVVTVAVLLAMLGALVHLFRLLRRGGMTAFRKSALFYAVLQLAFVGYWAAYAWGNRYR